MGMDLDIYIRTYIRTPFFDDAGRPLGGGSGVNQRRIGLWGGMGGKRGR